MAVERGFELYRGAEYVVDFLLGKLDLVVQDEDVERYGKRGQSATPADPGDGKIFVTPVGSDRIPYRRREREAV